MHAAQRGHLAVVRELLDRGAKINMGDRHYNTPLLYASEQGRLAVVKLLLDRGAKINQADDSGMNAVMLAASEGHLAVVRELIDRGAPINRVDTRGRTALMHTIQGERTRPYLGTHMQVFRFLLNRGARANSVIKSNNTPNYMKNMIKNYKARTIARYHKASTMRRSLAFIGSNFAKSLPPNMVRKILITPRT